MLCQSPAAQPPKPPPLFELYNAQRPSHRQRLTNGRDRVADRDVAAVEKLYELSGTSRLWGSTLPDRDQLYKELKVRRGNWMGISLQLAIHVEIPAAAVS